MLLHFIKKFGYNALPSAFFKWKFKQLKAAEKQYDSQIVNDRLDYYFKYQSTFEPNQDTLPVSKYKKTRGTNYYLDLKEFLHYIHPSSKIAYRFGDDTHEEERPFLTKARTIGIENATSILFKLNKKRHFKWINDKVNFEDKKDMLVWRGGAYRTLRRTFIEALWQHPLCNLGQTNSPKEDVPWQKDFLSIEEQLQYKFIFCPEGNDVATNLKWAMSSNSICFMPKPKFETWFMEGKLQAGVHYVEITTDWNDLTEKINYYSSNIDAAQTIIDNAHDYIKQFQDPVLEDILCLKVLERYIQMSDQKMKFQ